MSEVEARSDWERRIYQRLTGAAGSIGADLNLPAPSEVSAEPGTGHIRLSWNPVPGAAGYVIERTGTGPDQEPKVVMHGGSDVAAVVGPAFADTGVADGTDYRYRIAAVAGADYPAQAWSAEVQARTATAVTPLERQRQHTVTVTVDASAETSRLNRVWHMVGSERLSQLLLKGEDNNGEGSNGAGSNGADNNIAAEFAEALRFAYTDLGMTMVRAHAIFHDVNQVVRRDPENNTLQFDFSRVDAIYDQLLQIGLKPVVELSFMPAALARDPAQTVFTYKAIISPPADWEEWRQLIRAFAEHLISRYGLEEVAEWAFEVWNEANLEVFWPSTMDEYLKLYDESAKAIKAVSPRLRIGGPATAATEWIEKFAEHAQHNDIPLDFVSTHTYGNLPLDVRPALARHGFKNIPIWWTEWGVGSTHFGPVHDGVLGAPFVLSGFRSAQIRTDAVAYWVISDHFEELGRPPRLFHNGFGLLSVGNLRKPRYWAVHLAEQLGNQVLATKTEGDGAEVLVQGWAAKHVGGTVDILVWNGTINAVLASGDPRLNRHIKLTIDNLPASNYRVELSRIDQDHSNILAHFPADVTWPDQAQWAHLRAHDELYTERLPDTKPPARNGTAEFEFDLPMPGVARIRLSPEGERR